MTTNTKKSFSDKWKNNPNAFLDITLDPASEIFQWILSRNGFHSIESLRDYLSKKRRILDGGCGSGRVSLLLRKYAPPATEIVGIDLTQSAIDAAKENLKAYPNVSFEVRDLLSDLTSLGKFDFIYSQEVLHHTSDPKRAFLNLVRLLAPQGEIAIYVYKVKAPIREFADDYVRNKIASLDYEHAMAACSDITRLGKVLSDAKVEITIPEVPILGIERGTYDLQRFIYHFFLKCFWNARQSFEENAVINYDWYHPELASRHTLEEVRGWFVEAGLAEVQYGVDPYGITMRGALR